MKKRGCDQKVTKKLNFVSHMQDTRWRIVKGDSSVRIVPCD
jgi:hypothetical protein